VYTTAIYLVKNKYLSVVFGEIKGHHKKSFAT